MDLRRPQSKRYLTSLNFSQENFNKTTFTHIKSDSNPNVDSTNKEAITTIDLNSKNTNSNVKMDIKKYFDENNKKRRFNNLIQVIKTDIINLDSYIRSNQNFLLLFQDSKSALPTNFNRFSESKSLSKEKVISLNSINNSTLKSGIKAIKIGDENKTLRYNALSARDRAKAQINSIIEQLKGGENRIKDQIENISKTSDSIDSIVTKLELDSEKQNKDQLILRLFLENSLNELFFQKLKEVFFIEELKFYGSIEDLVDKSGLFDFLSRFN